MVFPIRLWQPKEGGLGSGAHALALEMGSDGIYTFDRQQSKLARAEGLKLH